MALSYVGGTLLTMTSTGTAVGSALPTGWAQGDLAWLTVEFGAAVLPTTLPDPAGWTRQLPATITNDVNGSVAYWARSLQSGDVAPTATFSPATRGINTVFAVRSSLGALTLASIVQANVNSVRTTSATAAATSLTPTAGDHAIYLPGGTENASGVGQTMTLPTSYTKAATPATNPAIQGATSVKQCFTGIFYRLAVPGTAEAPSTTLASSSTQHNALLVVREPVAAAAQGVWGVPL